MRAWYIPHRYGMVLLYLGTLFMVIGYHNNWVSFMKFLGLAMVILGILCVGSALGKSFSLMFEARVRDHIFRLRTHFVILLKRTAAKFSEPRHLRPNPVSIHFTEQTEWKRIPHTIVSKQGESPQL